ncbi:tetratricopeptide repeat protein [Pyxidicoccus parkwayensis]|uniref:Tetratricopeptide repeat protein n=1 Tax=Pyxidicoccus parkwayensis TaxID=2813578 RepID=A0ABX7NVS0_9BACT|nr:tetratricopeptide repeat protein [Pyxidicoccus parkwaysis]QSQ23036.1 tetratricopeptide repeat protein [Pyxidicoccus parkwaysis]
MIDEIGLLTGGRFEQFGYAVLRNLQPGEWVERGTTVEGAPRGYTVDTSAAGATLVGETSSELNYFDGDLEKPTKDLAHVIKLHPDVKRIWLLSSREASAGETTACANLATEFIKAHGTVDRVEILDARRIAEHIFENLDSERFVNTLVHYLPSVGRLADENAFSHRVPRYSGYLARPSEEKKALERLSSASQLVIAGISGIGKSALAARLAEILRGEFDIIIWIDARDLHDVSQLSDIEIGRHGNHQNISSLIRRYKCLLILDDAEITSQQVATMDLGRSKVVLTCQTTSDPNAIVLGDLDAGSARTLLEAGVPQPCPDKTFQRVWANVGGHPLLLVALNRLAQVEGWEAVDDCCEDAVDSVEDERHNKVCQRILLRHQAALAQELAFIKWCGTSRFDAELAEICVSSRAVKNLQKRAFLSATSAGDVRVHDIVYKSIQSVIHVLAAQAESFCRRLEHFIYSEGDREEVILRRIAYLHAPLLRQLLRENRSASFVYAVALARSGNTPLELIGDPIPTAQDIAARGDWSGREIEVRSVIEAVEALYTIASANEGAASARKSLEKNIRALEILHSSPSARGELLVDIKHHYAKMLERLGKLKEAEAEFRAILDEHPKFAAGRLQLARILAKTKRNKEALEECKLILGQDEVIAEPSLAAILLEALRLMSSIGSLDDVKSYEPLIVSALAKARDIDKSISFRLIAAVAQKMWYTMPELVLRMFGTIEWRDSVPTSDQERFDWAQAHKQAAKAIYVRDLRFREFLAAAVDVYELIEAPNAYQRVQYAEALILLERFGDANAQLESVGEPHREAFWWQRKAQALLGLGEAGLALVAINKALGMIKEQKYKAPLLHVRYLVKKALSDTSARDDLEEAIMSLSVDDKYRKQLEEELAGAAQPS